MKNEYGGRINGWQLMLLINGCQVGTGMFQLGRISEKSHTTWISVVIAAAVPILALWLMHQALKRYHNKNLPELAYMLFGKKMGFVLLIVYIFSQLILTAAVLRMQIELVSMNLLPSTPVPVIALLTILTTFIIINKGILAITRLNELMFYFSVVLLCFFISPIFKEAQLTNLLPLHEIDWEIRLKEALPLALLYGGTGVLFIWYPLLEEKEKMLRRSIWGVLLTMGTYLYLIIGCLLVYGADIMEYMLWPVLSLLKIVPNYLIQRSDFFVLGIWIGVGMRPIINFMFSASECASRLSKKTEKHHKKNFLWISALFCLIIWVVVLIPQNIVQGFMYINILSLYGACIGIFFPLIFWIGGMIYAKKQQKAMC